MFWEEGKGKGLEINKLKKKQDYVTPNGYSRFALVKWIDLHKWIFTF